MQEVPMKSYDIIIVGAGHNGMAAAVKLSKSGRKVLLLESSSKPGGMAVSNEFFKGYNTATLPHLINHLSSDIISELDLFDHGLEIKNEIIPSISIDQNHNHVFLNGEYGSNVEGINSEDNHNWLKLRKRLFNQANLLKRFIGNAPINQENISFLEKLKFLKAGLDLRFQGKEEFQEFFRMILMCVADVLEEEIESDLLSGIVSFDSTLGIRLGPRSPTSLMGLLYRFSGEFNGQQGAQIFPVGGMEQLIKSFYASVESSGVTTLFSQTVKNFIIKDGKVDGVITKEGNEYKSSIVLSSVSPILTFLELIGPKRLDTGFIRELKSLRYHGNVSKLNLALDRMPIFEGLDENQLSSRIVYAPSIDHIEKNFNPSKYQELPHDPNFELVFPNRFDQSLAPNGAAIASIIIQNTPYNLKNGWKKSKEKLQNDVLSRLESFSPGIKKSILASQFLSPQDIENSFNVPGGHWHHSELQIDRMYSLRPVFKYSNYKTPLSGLYVCGAGTHPGGGINGNSGINAAKQIIKDIKN